MWDGATAQWATSEKHGIRVPQGQVHNHVLYVAYG